MFYLDFCNRIDPPCDLQKKQTKTLKTSPSGITSSANRLFCACLMIFICLGRSTASSRGPSFSFTSSSLRPLSTIKAQQRNSYNPSRVPFSLLKSNVLTSLRGGDITMNRLSSSAFCLTSNRFLTSSTFDPLKQSRRQGRVSNKKSQKQKARPTLSNPKREPPNLRKGMPFPLFSTFDPSSSSTIDNSKNNSSENSTSKTSSFFDSVDERMKELQEEQEKKQKQKLEGMNNTKRSIFDMFPLDGDNENDSSTTALNGNDEETPNPKSFNKELFSSYHTIMEEIVRSTRFIKKKDKDEDVKVVTEYLLKDERITDFELQSLNITSSESQESEPVETDSASIKAQFEMELDEQRDVFLNVSNFTKVQHQLALRGLSVLGDFCAKRSLPEPLYIAWEKIKEAGMVPKDSSINTYLYVVGVAAASPSLLSTNSTHFPSLVNQSLPTEKDDDMALDVPGEIATFHDIMYEPTEKSVSLRIKRMVAKGDFAGAEKLLTTPIRQKTTKKKATVVDESQDALKLRTYFPILKGYCDQGDCHSAVRLFKRMRESAGVQLESENHVLVISTLAENGYFKKDSEPIKGATDKLGYAAEAGPRLFDELVQEMADDVLEITSASARRLTNAFDSAHTINNPDMDTSCDLAPQKEEEESDEDEEEDFLLKALPSLATMPVNNTQAGEKELVVSRILIDSTNATCPRTSAQLRLIMLEEYQKKEFHDALLRLSAQQFQTFVNSNSNFDPSLNESDEYAEEQLTKFADWLDNRKGDPFTAIIDGANVAYYGQNFQAGKFNYHQIKFLVDALESMNETVLVTVPHKYATKTFYCHNGAQSKRIVLSEAELGILNGLNDTGKLYRVPARCLDDYYWMLASVSNQTNSRKGTDLTVLPLQKDDNEDEDGDPTTEQQWPGTRPMLLSNDKMRDHKLELLAPRLFRRWTSSHLVNYNFTAFVGNECVDNEIGFSTPDFFSREIQGNPSGDGKGTAWHFPVADWSPNERFCVRIPE